MSFLWRHGLTGRIIKWFSRSSGLTFTARSLWEDLHGNHDCPARPARSRCRHARGCSAGPGAAACSRRQATPEAVATNEIIGAMLKAAKNTSDLIFSPGKAPQVEVNGQLLQVQIPRVGTLSAQATARIAADLIGKNAEALRKLREQGSCDLSYSLSAFRVFASMSSCSAAATPS